MRHIFPLFLLVIAPNFLVVPAAWSDEMEVRQFIQEYVSAYNKQELEAVAAKWGENATHLDRETGVRTDGRTAIQADLAETFAKSPKSHLSGEITRIRFVKPDVVIIEGTSVTSLPDEEPVTGQFSGVLVKQGATWQIASIEELPAFVPESSAVALRALEWLEGSWLDDSEESPVTSVFRWSSNRTFLIRSFVDQGGPESTPLGTQIIGWDARSQQIRSWTFNADGSFGDGVWSESDGAWSIKASETMADGRVATGTYVLTAASNDAFTIRLIGQEIEGESVPNSAPVTLTRVSETTDTGTDKSAPQEAQ